MTTQWKIVDRSFVLISVTLLIPIDDKLEEKHSGSTGLRHYLKFAYERLNWQDRRELAKKMQKKNSSNVPKRSLVSSPSWKNGRCVFRYGLKINP